jgi:hypothetical protein
LGLTRSRASIVLAAALAPLAAAAPASAHSRSAPVALDYRLRLSAPPGIVATALDGDRTLRLRVDPALTVVVRGYLGEPFLRFAPDGVWVNGRSPTAASDKVGRSGATGWTRVARGHTFAWHEHRLTPPRLSLPVTIAGRTASISGLFVRVARPRVWPWLVGALAAVACLALLARQLPSRRGEIAVAAAVVAALGTLAGSVAYADAGATTRASDAWGEAAYSAALALAASCVVLIRNRSVRAWAAVFAGTFAAAFGLRFVSVFWHGVVISALSPTAVRLATAVAVVGGAAATGVGVLAREAWHDLPLGARR